MTREDEARVRQIIREELSALTQTTDCGVDEPIATAGSRFTEIVADINTRKWATIVEITPDDLVDALVASRELLPYEAHKRLDRILLLDQAPPMRTAPHSCREIGKLLREAKTEAEATRDQALHAVPTKTKSEIRDGKTRNQVFAEENDRKALYEDVNLPPLDANRWAYRRCS